LPAPPLGFETAITGILDPSLQPQYCRLYILQYCLIATI
jgi:hypothetical protein